jgi:hypothetical protein
LVSVGSRWCCSYRYHHGPCQGQAASHAVFFKVALPLLLSAVLFLALSLPYLIVGIQPNLTFYETSHLLLFGLPGALLVLGFKGLVQSAIGDRAALVGVFGLAAIVSISALWNSYMFMQARALREEALSSHLGAIPMPAATVFDLADGFENYSPRFTPFGIAEVTGMLLLAWGAHPFFRLQPARRAADYPAGNGIRLER